MRWSNVRWFAVRMAGIIAMSAFSLAMAGAQEFTRGYDAIAAGEDAYRYHEARRVGDISRQIGLIQELKWYSALPLAGSGPVGTTVWYGGGAGAGYYRDPPSLDYVYATGRRSAYGYGAWGRGLTPLYGGAFHRDIFSPWPYVPGDIWGYQWADSVPQSIGQRQIQTGPNRWESHPVYGTPPSVVVLEEPPTVQRELPRAEPRRRAREF